MESGYAQHDQVHSLNRSIVFDELGCDKCCKRWKALQETIARIPPNDFRLIEEAIYQRSIRFFIPAIELYGLVEHLPKHRHKSDPAAMVYAVDPKEWTTKWSS